MAGREHDKEKENVIVQQILEHDPLQCKETTRRGKSKSRSCCPHSPRQGGPSSDNNQSHLARLESFIVDIMNQVDQFRESVESMIKKNDVITMATKMVVNGLAKEFQKELDTISRDLLYARQFVEDRIFEILQRIDDVQTEVKARHRDTSSEDPCTHTSLCESGNDESNRRMVEKLDDAMAVAEAHADTVAENKEPIPTESGRARKTAWKPNDRCDVSLGNDEASPPDQQTSHVLSPEYSCTNDGPN